MQNLDRVNDLIFICERMIEILTIENDALKNHKSGIIQERLDEKTKLSLFYERHMKAIQRSEDAFKDVEPDILETLRELGQEMNELLDENGRLLEIAMDSNKRVIQAIATAAKDNTPHGGVYSNKAQIGPKAEESLAVAINQEL